MKKIINIYSDFSENLEKKKISKFSQNTILIAFLVFCLAVIPFYILKSLIFSLFFGIGLYCFYFFGILYVIYGDSKKNINLKEKWWNRLVELIIITLILIGFIFFYNTLKFEQYNYNQNHIPSTTENYY